MLGPVVKINAFLSPLLIREAKRDELLLAQKMHTSQYLQVREKTISDKHIDCFYQGI